VGAGLAVNAAAGVVNFAVARVLLAAGRKHRSIALEADARHLLADVWTSAGVIVGVAAVAATGWLWLDPLLALAVAGNILWWGVRLMRRSALGLLDRALPEADRRAIDAALEPYRAQGIEFHALRTRAAAGRSFVSMHVLVPGAWSVQRGHDAVEEIEEKVRAAVAGATVFTHLEPREDPASYRDERLDRQA
jgi:cation diffusion facilitator family transporter